MTGLGVLNFLVLQWFGVRLARCEINVTCGARIGYAVGERVSWYDGTRNYRGRIAGVEPDGYRLRWYEVIRWVYPLTGWWSDYRWIARRR